MRRNLKRGVLAAVTGLCLFAASSASAATDFGDTCTGGGVAPGDYTLTTLSAPPAALPLTAPSGGVITKIKVNNTGEIPIAIPTAVKVLRSAGGNSFTVVDQQTVMVAPGGTVADARMRVQAGDRLGLHGEPFTYEGSPVPSLSLFCTEVEGDLGAATGDVKVGSTAEFPKATTARVPLAATIEPDADGDGYGDETQDKCPQSAALQTACPVAALSASSVVRKSFARVLVTSSVQAQVTVAGKVKLGKGKTAKLSGGSQVVVPGTIAKFTLIFPSGVKSKLKELSRKQSLQLVLTATAPNIVGAPTVSTLKAKVKGQKKPVHKGKGGKQG